MAVSLVQNYSDKLIIYKNQLPKSNPGAKQMLSHIINIGVKKGQQLSEIKRIKLLNKIAILLCAGVMIKLFHEIVAQDLRGALIALLVLSLYLITFVLNHFGQAQVVKIYLPIVITVSLTTLDILFGNDLGTVFGFFPLIMMIVIFFEKVSEKIIWLCFFGITYTLTTIYQVDYQPPLLADLSESSYFYMFVICCSTVFLLSLIFINENKHFESQTNRLLDSLKKKNDELENVNGELEKFAYVASHDLKTPLRNINSFLNLIQRKIKNGNTSEINEYLEYASLNAQRMHDLIQDILEFSQVSKEKVSFKNNDLNTILNKALTNLKNLIDEKGVTIEVSKKLPEFFSNESQIVSLFQNLIENGIKYNQNPNPHIKIECVDSQSEYEIYFSDNGIGIEKEYQSKIFEMFTRLHNQGEYPGSGIGLAVCKKVATFHGGNITIASSPGKGSTFCIAFPKHSQDQSIQQDQAISTLA